MLEKDELFDGGLDGKLDFLNEQKSASNDGIYRVDLSKCKDKKKGWRSVVRFLPNLTRDQKLGQSAIEKINHYVNIKNPRELSGWFDSPKNFNEKCALTDLYYQMQNSKNAVLIEKSKQLNYSKKYYSYVLVIEDEQQPELKGKIMIFQYGKTIKDKILAEKNGEISGEECNVFDLEKGKNFVLIAKEIQTGDITYPDYKMSSFEPNCTAIPVFNKEKNSFVKVPLDENGKISPNVRGKVKEFLLDREHDLEEFAPKRLTDEENGKINEIINFLTGKTSTAYSNRDNSPSSDDFTFSDDLSDDNTESSFQDSDDFFDDL